ncbi:serine/threonine-protein kinase [Streptomyces sp. NPDC018338]|uniref:serine/threonine-protein kinase n=1 Tax=Streptomyces sp. NPDC018338 TaxID=3157192 RepID=UPI0033F5828A
MSRVQPARPGDPNRIGPYRIIGRLGSGGMGTVHAGLDAAGQRVAIKMVHGAQAEDPEFRARFRREVALSARVNGPCLLPLLDADTETDTPWLATAYAPGPTLGQRVAEHGPLTSGSLYAFAAGTAQALAAIHAVGVIHRDVKPQNVILSPSGPRVLDFGIAHATDGTSVTRTGVMTGTPGWISPEHYRTGTAGPEGDMFAWGALVAYAATGRLPFGTGAPDVVAFRVMSADADLDGVPEQLLALITGSLAKEPEERMTAEAVAEAASRLLAAQTTQVITPGQDLPATMVGDLIAAEWHMPTLDDPTWRAHPVRSRMHLYIAVGAAAAVTGALASGLLVLPSGSAATPPAAAATSTAAPTATSSPGRSIDSSPATSQNAAGSRTPDPGYTRTDDAQPMFSEYDKARGASAAAEQGAGTAIKDRTLALLAVKGMTNVDATITFNHEAQTVFVASDPQPTWSEAEKEYFARSAQMAACTELSERLKTDRTWAYGRYTVMWRELMTPADSSTIHIQTFGKADNGCDRTGGSGWNGHQSGLNIATIPSVRQDEIRAAGRTAKNIHASWTQGGGTPVPTNAAQVGFDPVENVMYVWTDHYEWTDIYSDAYQQVASTVACEVIADMSRADKNWPYQRYSVVAIRGNSGADDFLASGNCSQ